MPNLSNVQPANPGSGKRRRRTSALTRSAGVLIAAGAMVVTAFVVASPAGASVTSSPGADLQAVAAVSPITGWADTGSMITPRARHAGAQLADGRVLVAGGSTNLGFGGNIASSELYNPATGTWQAAADMPIAVADAAAVTLADGTVLVAGGTSNVTELYNATTNTWTVGPQMPAMSGGNTFAATLPNGRVFVLGSSAAEYDPAARTWTALARMPGMTASLSHDTTMLANGDVVTLRAMQYDCCMPGSPITGPSVYHWATNTWTTLPVPPVNPGDSGVSVAALPNGNVMLADGVMGYLWFPAAVNTVLEVNPTTGAWTIDQDLPRPYGYLVALPNGSILATQGFPDHLYSPTARTWTEVPGDSFDSPTFTTLANGTVLRSGGYSDRTYNSNYFVLENHASILTPPSTTTPTPATHHIGDLDNATASLSSLKAASSLKAVSSAKWQPRVAATVLDANGKAVTGATVSGTFSHHRGTLTCVTAANGICTLGNFSLARSTSSTVFTVTGVVKASSTYTPKANSDPDGDSNGTTITVKRP